MPWLLPASNPATITSTTGKTGDDYLRSLQIACTATTGAGAYDFQGEATLHANDYATVQALLGELGKSFPAYPAYPGGSIPACPAAITDAATSAAAATSYLAARLAATKGAIPSAFGSGTDWTTTANAVLDLEAAHAGSAAIAPALTALQADTKAYVKTAGAYAPGPLATLLMVAHATGVDPTAFGGVDLATALSSTERVASAAPPRRHPSPRNRSHCRTRRRCRSLGVGALLVGLGDRRRAREPAGRRRRVGQHGC